MSSEGISSRMPQRTSLMGFQIWSLVGICMGVLLIIILAITLCFWIFLRSYESKNKKKTTTNNKKKRRFRSSNISNNGLSPLEDSCSIFPTSPIDICVDKATPASNGRVLLSITDSSSVDGLPEKVLLHLGISRKLYSNGSNKGASRGSRRDTHMDMSMPPLGGSRSEIKKVEIEEDSESSFWQSKAGRGAGSGGCITPRDFSLGWGHWYSLQELEDATHGFSHENVIGEGGYGVVYKGQLVNGTIIAVKYLLNNVGEAEKEFQAEVETIGRVRHKNLVHLLGYCIERRHCFLVYEFIDNGNLEQWLHGALGKDAPLTWEARIRIALGTSKGLQYLHEALEPKVVHRDIKSSNILVDKQWNSKVSDFGLAKILESEKSHVSTRVMGTFGYVAPEYASTGLLNEQSDVYSFGVLLVEIITGRDPIDYSRPTEEVNLVDWLKAMVRTQRSEEILDPRIEVKPPVRVLKRLLLIALHCLDPVSEKRPKMGHVVHMLEAEEFPREFGYYRGSTKERDQSRTNNEIPEGSLQHILKQDSALHYVHEDLDEDDEKGQTKNHGI